MPSPFPGMDPYLERPGEWESFHVDFIVQMKRELARVLGGKYRAKAEVMLFIHEPSARRRQLGKADDAVSIRAPAGTPGPSPGSGGAAVVEPSARMRLGDAIDIEKHRYIEVRTVDGERLVTVIELLSPSNKQNASDRQVYLNKRAELYRDGVHFLQLDLLRGGRRLLPEQAPPHDYNAMLMRGDRWPEVDVWFWGVRDRLPALPVPLLEGDADVPLDLQATLDEVYDAGGYGPFLYDRPPDRPLRADDAAWAGERIGSAARR